MNDTAFLTWPAETLLPAQGMRVAIFDVDGVLTDGGLYLDVLFYNFHRGFYDRVFLLCPHPIHL